MFRQLITGLVLSQLMLIASPFHSPAPKVVYGSYIMTPEVAAPTREAHQRSRTFLTLDRPFATQGKVDSNTLARCENNVAQVFDILPVTHVEAVKNLTLSFDPTIRRGLAGGNTLILRCVNVPNDAEMIAVLVHEIGHVVDTGLLNASKYDLKTKFVDRGKVVYSSDPSTKLYGVSWENNRSLKGMKRDFVSGYALESPYEEFAETYIMYVLHGPLFRLYAAHNKALKMKYEFMRDVVFEGVEYNFASEKLPPILQVMDRHYDATRLDYGLESFLALRGSTDS